MSSGVEARVPEGDEPIEIHAAAAVAGDARALEAVWGQHRRWVAAILLAHKPRWADVDDLLQEVAMSLVRKVGEIRDPSAIRPWLRTVAVNAARAAARPGKHRGQSAGTANDETVRPGVTTGLTADQTPPPERLADEQAGRRLMELSQQLAEGYREPLLLKAVQGLSYREIGRILGLPETTVETRIARARRQLRELAASEKLGAGEG